MSTLPKALCDLVRATEPPSCYCARLARRNSPKDILSDFRRTRTAIKGEVGLLKPLLINALIKCKNTKSVPLLPRYSPRYFRRYFLVRDDFWTIFSGFITAKTGGSIRVIIDTPQCPLPPAPERYIVLLFN